MILTHYITQHKVVLTIITLTITLQTQIRGNRNDKQRKHKLLGLMVQKGLSSNK